MYLRYQSIYDSVFIWMAFFSREKITRLLFQWFGDAGTGENGMRPCVLSKADIRCRWSKRATCSTTGIGRLMSRITRGTDSYRPAPTSARFRTDLYSYPQSSLHVWARFSVTPLVCGYHTRDRQGNRRGYTKYATPQRYLQFMVSQ